MVIGRQLAGSRKSHFFGTSVVLMFRHDTGVVFLNSKILYKTANSSAGIVFTAKTGTQLDPGAEIDLPLGAASTSSDVIATS